MNFIREIPYRLLFQPSLPPKPSNPQVKIIIATHKPIIIIVWMSNHREKAFSLSQFVAFLTFSYYIFASLLFHAQMSSSRGYCIPRICHCIIWIHTYECMPYPTCLLYLYLIKFYDFTNHFSSPYTQPQCFTNMYIVINCCE